MCQDIYDYEFLAKKNQQNLQYQELNTSFSDLGRWIWLKYRRAKWFNTCVRNRKRAWKKFKGELGFHEVIPVKKLSSQSGNMMVIGYRN